MDDDERRQGADRRVAQDRRSGTDTRSADEKQLFGERRSRIDRRSDRDRRAEQPSTEHLALFARRLKRTMNNEKSRGFFGVANGEYDFQFYPDVLRTVEWIESLTDAGPDQPADPAGPGNLTLRKA